MLVLYNYNSNYKHVHTTPTRTGYHILLVYQRSHKLLPSRDLHPKLPKLDNEASCTLIDFLDNKHVLFQLYALCIHWMNVAEQTTHMFKNYFIVRICDTDHSFNLKLLDKLLPQTILTFNLHRSIHLNPRISIYSQIYGTFDTNQAPLAPPGTNLFIHGTLDQRPTWSPHVITDQPKNIETKRVIMTVVCDRIENMMVISTHQRLTSQPQHFTSIPSQLPRDHTTALSILNTYT